MEQAEQFRRLAEASLQGILVHDGHRRLFANPAFAQMYGYPDVAAALAVESVGQHVVPQSEVASLETEWQRILSERRGSSHSRVRRRHLDGRTMWVDLHLGPITWDGRPAIHGIQVDVTREVEAEAGLLHSEARFRRLADESLQGIVIHDGQRRLFANEAFARMMGYRDVASVLADPVTRHIPPAEVSAEIEAWGRTLAGELTWSRRRVRRRRIDGSLMWLDLMRGPAVWDGQPAVQVIQVDVTREVEAEAELRRSAARLRAVIDNLPAILSLKDADRRYVLVNPEFERWYDTTAAHIDGRLPETLGLGVGDASLLSDIRTDDLRVLETGRGSTRQSVRTSARGECRTLMVTKFPVCNEAGRVDGVGTIATDISELKEAQARLERRETELRRNQAAILQVLRDEVAGGSVPDRVRRIVQLAGETLRVDCAAVWRTDRNSADLRCVLRWRAPDVSRAEIDFPTRIPLADVPEFMAALDEQFVLAIDDDHADPLLASFAATHYRAVNLTAGLFAVIRLPDGIHGHLGFGMLDRPRAWSVEDQAFASSIAELLGVCFLQDAFEQRAQALRDSEARFRAAIDNLPLILTLKDTDHRYRIVNREFERFNNVRAADAIGRTPEELTHVASVARGEEVRNDEDEVIETGLAKTRERQRTNAAGELRHTIVTKFAVRGAAGRTDGVGTIVTDISALKQAQMQLVRRETELRRNQAAILQMLRDQLTRDTGGDRIKGIVALAGQTLEVESVALWRVDREAGVLRCVERWCAPHVQFATSDLPTTIPIADTEEFYVALQQNIVLALDDHRSDPRFKGMVRHWERLGISASLAATIQLPDARQDYVGFSHYGTARAWSVEDQSFARSVAELIGLCSFQDELARREREQRRNQDTMARIVREGLLGGGTTQEIFNAIVRIACTTLGLVRVGVWTYVGPTTDSERVCTAQWRQDVGQYAGPDDAPPISAQSLRAWFTPDYFDQLQHDLVVAIEDVSSDRRLTEAGRAFCRATGVGARMNALVRLPDRAVGAVTFLAGPGARRWSAEDRAFARSVGDLVAFAFLSERHRQALAALDLVGQGLYVENEHGEVIYANRVARRLAGVADGAAVPLPALPAPPERGDAACEIPWRAPEGGVLELALARTNLSEGAITVLADVTERNARERERAGLEAEMRQAAKLEAVGRLAGGIAHDFNNLLGAVLGFANFLREDLPEDSAQHGYATRIIKASEHAKEVVKQLLAFTRASDVERRVADLRELVEDGRELLRASLPSSSHFTITTARNPLRVLVNNSQVHQILLNLCLNANDALGGEPGTISLSLARVRGRDAGTRESGKDVAVAVSGHLDPKRSYARLSVADDGTGMDAATVARVFEPFFTTKAPGHGTGLGLAVVHGIVAAYGGICMVESVVGRGSRFSIFLPLVENELSEAEEAVSAARVRGSEAILVVDDETYLLEMMCVGLERLGYTVTGCADPLQALERFEAEPTRWHAVVTDEVMPGMKGSALIAKLRAISPQCLAVLCTGFSDGTTERHAMNAGAAGFFLKPVAPLRIAEKIRGLLDANGHAH